ncbi:hypothetical protein BDV96DRAFT_643886 [Lophiotrema nucula]|uniref:Uncharacterized protein n=1 Tax=Lophiotrema nucula TaxID=690887 RepID=A0A6A5ZEZ9_9PLEO|nr:hypothetical protein BDV96DRAFT_643886 [Lophiotrema nucula]
MAKPIFIIIRSHVKTASPDNIPYNILGTFTDNFSISHANLNLRPFTDTRIHILKTKRIMTEEGEREREFMIVLDAWPERDYAVSIECMTDSLEGAGNEIVYFANDRFEEREKRRAEGRMDGNEYNYTFLRRDAQNHIVGCQYTDEEDVEKTVRLDVWEVQVGDRPSRGDGARIWSIDGSVAHLKEELLGNIGCTFKTKR